MRYGIFSDTHANLPALEAVLRSFDEENVDALACLGDTATFTGDTTRSAERACLALTESETRNRLLRDDHLQDPCTMQYGGPQTATISGVLEGQVVETTVDRADGCGIHAWGVSLAALLPEPV